MEPSWSMRLRVAKLMRAPTRRMMASSLGKIRDVDGVTFVRRLIFLFSRSSGLVECSLFQWSFGKAI